MTSNSSSNSLASTAMTNPKGLCAFPFKLRDMLEDAEQNGWTHLVSWELNGNAFKVHDPDEFVKHIMPLYFRQTKYKSFQRQLNLYNFCRFSKGPYKGCYLHEHFVRGQEAGLGFLVTRRKAADDDINNNNNFNEEVNMSSPDMSSANIAANITVDPIPLDQLDFNNFALPASAVNVNNNGMAQDVSIFGASQQQRDPSSSQADNALERLLDNMMGSSNNSNNNNAYSMFNSTKDSITSVANVAALPSVTDATTANTTARRKNANITAFPAKLHKMLESIEDSNQQHIASWVSGGKAFKVHDQEAFVDQIMPKFFNQTKYESLQRQLNLYGFSRIPKGAMKGCYHHPLFLQGDDTLCRCIVRKKNDDVFSSGPRFRNRNAYKAIQSSNNKMNNLHSQGVSLNQLAGVGNAPNNNHAITNTISNNNTQHVSHVPTNMAAAMPSYDTNTMYNVNNNLVRQGPTSVPSNSLVLHM